MMCLKPANFFPCWSLLINPLVSIFSIKMAAQNSNILLFLTLTAICNCSIAETIEWRLLVSPSGSDTYAHCDDSELAHCIEKLTLVQAINIVSKHDWQGAGANVQIELAPGIYRIPSTLHIDWGKSANRQNYLSITGPKGGTAVISGAQVVEGLHRVDESMVHPKLTKQAKKNVLEASLAGLQGLKPSAPIARGFGKPIVPVSMEVFFRGYPMSLARWPNLGFGKIKVAKQVLLGEAARHLGIEGRQVTDWTGENNLIAVGYFGQDWAEESYPVEFLDQSKNEIVLSGNGPQYGTKPGQRIRILGALSELDEPGEWYFDSKTRMLYLWPPEAVRDGDVEISVQDSLFRIDGARNVRIANLTFEMARGDAITVSNSENVVIEHGFIRNIGNRAAVFSLSSNSGLRHVTIDQTGEGGVVLQGGDRRLLKPANLFVEDCRISYFSRLSSTYKPAVMLLGVGHRVVRNVLSNAPHSAIIFNGNDHLIAFNNISQVVQATDDAGAIYTGRDWTTRGTVIANNFLHDIGNKNGHAGTMGIYLDDQTSGITVRGNIFARVPYPVFIGGGRDNVVEQNLMFNSSPAIYLDARGLGWERAFTLDKKQTLQRNLDAVPYNRPPYSDRYRHLANIREDDIGKPKYNIARCNLVVGGVLFDIEKAALSGILTENNFVSGDTIFSKKMPTAARQGIKDFQLDMSAPGPNKDCMRSIVESVSSIDAALRMTQKGATPLIK